MREQLARAHQIQEKKQQHFSQQNAEFERQCAALGLDNSQISENVNIGLDLQQTLEDVQCLVIEAGSSMIKAGFGGDDGW
jgi:hypothetical protein